MNKGLFDGAQVWIDRHGLKVKVVAYELQFRRPFRLAKGVRTHTDAAYLAIEMDGLVGYGEACLPPYLGASLEDVWQYWRQYPWEELARQGLKGSLDLMPTPLPEHRAAAAAIDMALHDLLSRKERKPLYGYLGVPAPNSIETTYTLGMSTEEELSAKLIEGEPFRTIKLKLGGNGDQERLHAFKKRCGKSFCADANQAYRRREAALEMAQHLAQSGALFLEQPMPVGMEEDMAWVRDRSPIPIVADESVRSLEDLERYAGCFDGFNVKLMKSAGLTGAINMLRRVRELKKTAVLGAMAESSCGATAAAHLAPLADFVDLDGPLLLSNDPFSGIAYRDGLIDLPFGVGIGAVPLS